MDPLWLPPPPPDFKKYYPYDDLSFLGQNSYLLYLSHQRRFVTWLVKAADELGGDIQSASWNIREPLVPFGELTRLAEIVRSHGKVPQCTLTHLDYMLQLRGNWNPRNEKPYPPNSKISDDVINQHFDAMLTLRIVKDILLMAPVVPDQGEFTEEDYSLPVLEVAWVCFFNDLLVIRAYLIFYWQSYQQSFDALTSKALVTNTAIRLIRANCDAHILATMHLPGTPPEYNIPEWLCRGITGVWQTDHPFEENARTNVLREKADELREIKELMESQPSYGASRAKAVRGFVDQLCAFLHNVSALRRANDTPFLLPCLDELTCGWLLMEDQGQDLLKQGVIPLWLIVSLQIYADIRLALGRYSPTVLDDLKEHSQSRMALFRKYLPHSMTKKSLDKGPKGGKDHSLGSIKYVAQCVMKDNYIRLLMDYANIGKIESIEYRLSYPDFYFLEMNPALCGMQSWWLEHQYRTFEFYTVKLHEAIVPAALLYVSMRRKGLVSQWRDMDFVLQTRGVDIIASQDDHWEHYDDWPDSLTVCTSLSSQFSMLYEKCYPVQHNPVERYLADFLSCYLDPDQDPPPIKSSLRKMIRRTYPYPYLDWRKKIAHDLQLEDNQVTNMFAVLDLLSAARYVDESLAAFDWFRMHDICENFFHFLRKNYLAKYEGFISMDPNRGLHLAPEHGGHGPYSLDALYYLLFAEPSDRGVENMILASLCISPNATQSYDMPDREYLLEMWGDDIMRHIEELGVSLESAAVVLQSLIEQEGREVYTKAAQTERAHHKVRAEVPEDSADWIETFGRNKWYHPSNIEERPNEFNEFYEPNPQTSEFIQDPSSSSTSETLDNDPPMEYAGNCDDGKYDKYNSTTEDSSSDSEPISVFSSAPSGSSATTVG
ncbi:hypothetical protein F5Y12DRAFT_794347 [Xylaria sp. FL1777]|nr:hypothetical protein F5Y12DRAFT_794347 [Xylaria sp. FL1777]